MQLHFSNTQCGIMFSSRRCQPPQLSEKVVTLTLVILSLYMSIESLGLGLLYQRLSHECRNQLACIHSFTFFVRLFKTYPSVKKQEGENLKTYWVSGLYHIFLNPSILLITIFFLSFIFYPSSAFSIRSMHRCSLISFIEGLLLVGWRRNLGVC